MSPTEMLFTACCILIIPIAHSTEVPAAYWTSGNAKVPTILPKVCWNSDLGCDIIPGNFYGVQTWTDDLLIDPQGISGWSDGSCPVTGDGECTGHALRTQSEATTTKITPFEYSENKYYYYHGDFSGAKKYAQGTVNSFHRYFQCPFEAHLEVKFSARFCGSETEDKIFLQVNGVQLGEEMNLGCSGTTASRGDRPGSYAQGSDGALSTSCPGGGYAAWSNCDYNQYMNVGELSFHETSKQWYPAYTPIQVQFFWRFSYQDDHIWIYNTQLTCLPSARGITKIHASLPEDISWIDQNGEPTSEWNDNLNWKIQSDSCGELIADLGDDKFTSGPLASPNRPTSDQYQPVQAKSTGTSWCGPSKETFVDSLEIDLGSDKAISEISTWGAGLCSSDWVKKYNFNYKTESGSWQGTDTLMNANSNTNSVNSESVSGVTARFLKFTPTEANNWPCMRVEAETSDGTPLIANLDANDFSATASRASTQYQPIEARKDGTAWCGPLATVSDTSTDYLQINLGKITQVGYVRTWGRSCSFAWTTKYKLQYSTDGSSWTPYDGGAEITGNTDATSHVTQQLNGVDGISAQYLRFIPTGAHTWPCMRVDAFNPSVRSLVALLPDSSFSTSQFQAFQAKQTDTTSWCGPDTNFATELIIDLGSDQSLTQLQTWGGGSLSNDWVSQYIFSYKSSTVTEWADVVLDDDNGNVDATSARTTSISVTANQIKFKPTKANNWPCMRVEVSTASDSLIQSLANSQFSTNPSGTSGYRTTTQNPENAKQGSSSAWCGSTIPATPYEFPNTATNSYLQIDLGSVKTFQYIYTWGDGGNNWVKKFDIRYSKTETGAWQPYDPKQHIPFLGSTAVPNEKSGNTNGVDSQLINLGEIEARYIRFVPTEANNVPCMRVEIQQVWWNPLCLDDEEPKYFHDGHIVSFQGRFRWDTTGLMGSKNDGLIGIITEVDARPQFDEEFTVVTQQGVTLNIEIENTGMIYLRVWTVPYGYFDVQDAGSGGVFYTHEKNIALEGDVTNGYSLATSVPDEQIEFGDLDTIKECALDGIVYVSRTGWQEAEPFSYTSSEESITTPGLPFNYVWDINIHTVILYVLVTGIIFALLIRNCGNKNRSDYSKVKTVSYDDTESDVV